MQGVRTEVTAAVEQLGLLSVRTIEPAEGMGLYAALETRFSKKPNARWIWEHLIGPWVSRQCNDGGTWVSHLANLVTNPTQRLLLFAGSDEDDVCVVEAVISDISAILGECSAFEYCIAPGDLAWLLCETHHGSLVGVGAPVADRLAALRF